MRDARQAGDKLEDDAERRAHSGEDPRRPGSATETLKLKVVLVGPRGVGKTSLVRRHVQNAFDDAYWSTVGTNVYKWTAILDVGGHAVRVGMAVWDTAGESHVSESLIDLYLYGVQGVLAVCDVTDAGTVPALVPWVDAVRRVAGDVPVHILLNKSDRGPDPAAREAGLRAGLARAAPCYLTSARAGDNVAAAFEDLARRIVERAAVPWEGPFDDADMGIVIDCSSAPRTAEEVARPCGIPAVLAEVRLERLRCAGFVRVASLGLDTRGRPRIAYVRAGRSLAALLAASR